MRTRRGLRRGQGDSESRTGREEGLKESRTLGEMWVGSLVGAEGRREQPGLQEWLRGPAEEGGVAWGAEELLLDKGRRVGEFPAVGRASGLHSTWGLRKSDTTTAAGMELR